jgi:hypothetical protein
LLICSVAILFYGCKKEGTNTTNGEGEIAENTKIISKETNSLIKKIDYTSITYITTNPELEKIKIGDILFSPSTVKTPYGFLRRVMKIEKNSSEVVMTTEQAAITAAIKNCNVHFQKEITEDDILTQDSSGISIVPRSSITFPLQETMTTSDGKTYFVSGKVDFKLILDLDFEIENFKLKRFLIKKTVTNKSVITGKIYDPGNTKSKLLTRSIKLRPLQIPVASLGPIAFDGYIEVSIYADGSIQAGIETEYGFDEAEETGFEYTGSSWQPIKKYSNLPIKRLEPFGSASAEIGLQVSCLLRPIALKVADIEIGTKGYLQTSAKLNGTCGLTVDAKFGADLFGKVKMSIWGLVLADYEKSLNIHEESFLSKQMLKFRLSPSGFGCPIGGCGLGVTNIVELH